MFRGRVYNTYLRHLFLCGSAEDILNPADTAEVCEGIGSIYVSMHKDVFVW